MGARLGPSGPVVALVPAEVVAAPDVAPALGRADDPEGGLGIPARLADLMSMLHVRLLSLESKVV